jgi:hypothetical protein
MDDAGQLCLACADLDHPVFLPAGDAALTRRATKASSLSAVVLRWSRARKRYERQGVLVEDPALTLAEEQCLSDEAARTRPGGVPRAPWGVLSVVGMVSAGQPGARACRWVIAVVISRASWRRGGA